MRATLAGEFDADPPALALRAALAARGLDPQHGLDLLTAFRRDAVQTRYADWAELMDYCRYSAMPVGPVRARRPRRERARPGRPTTPSARPCR